VSPCFGAMRARMIDDDLGALAGQQIGDVDLRAVGGPDAGAGFVELRRGDVVLHGRVC